MAKKKEPELQKVGGLVFYTSLAALVLLLRPVYSALLPSWNSGSPIRLLLFAAAALIGAAAVPYLITAKTSIFIHELKHSILSNLVGNRAKKLEVRKHDGSFEYEYSERTAAYNAFISLAPYCLPLFTLAALVVALPFFHSERLVLAAALGAGWGADLRLNLRDIAPHQSDLSYIRGGIPVALAYIALFNLVILGLLTLWITGGISAYKHLFNTLAEMVLLIAHPFQT